MKLPSKKSLIIWGWVLLCAAAAAKLGWFIVQDLQTPDEPAGVEETQTP